MMRSELPLPKKSLEGVKCFKRILFSNYHAWIIHINDKSSFKIKSSLPCFFKGFFSD